MPTLPVALLGAKRTETGAMQPFMGLIYIISSLKFLNQDFFSILSSSLNEAKAFQSLQLPFT